MKSTFFSASAVFAAAVLAVSSSVSADVEGRPSGLARRHHAKVARAVTGETHTLEKRAFHGKATWYGVHAGDMGACGTHLNADDYFVALNQGQYGNLNQQSSYCGKKITITNGIKTTQATILDACPKGEQCHWGALDMSRSLFSFFNDFGVGVFDITWWISGEGGNDDSSSSSSKSDNNSNDDSSNDDSSNNNDASEAEQAASEKAAKQRAAAKKEAAAKKAKAAAAKKAAEEKKQKKEEAAKKKKEAAKKAKKEAEKKAQDKIREAQNQNIAAFGEIMQQLNAMVENAVDSGSSDSASTTADDTTTTTTSA